MQAIVTKKSAIRGPNFFSFINNVRHNPVLYCYSLMKQYGDVVKCPSIQNIYLVSHPELAKEVFNNVHRVFDKNNFINDRLRVIMGDGLVLSTGARWKRQRKTAALALRKEEVKKCEPLVDAIIDERIAALEMRAPGAPINLSLEIRDLMMEIMGACLLGIRQKDILDNLKRCFIEGVNYVSSPIPFDLPRFLQKKGTDIRTIVKYIDDLLLKIISEHQEGINKAGILISPLTEQKDEQGNALDTDEMLTEAKNIFISSYFSTADFTIWLLYILAANTEWDRILHSEMEGSSGGSLTRGGYEAQLFIHEALRCYPPAWASSHHLLQDFKLGNYLIPRHSTILVSLFNVHRHPEFWEDADIFDPNRFRIEADKFPKAFMPFGYGPRKCVGNGLANLVIDSIFSKFLQKFQFSTVPGDSVKILSRVTLGTEKDVYLNIKPRKQI